MAISIDKNGEGYFHGDKAKLTGRKDENTYDIALHELEFVEGRNKGEKFWQSIRT